MNNRPIPPKPSKADEMLTIAINSQSVQSVYNSILKQIELAAISGDTEMSLVNPKQALVYLLQINGFIVTYDVIQSSRSESFYKIKWIKHE